MDGICSEKAQFSTCDPDRLIYLALILCTRNRRTGRLGSVTSKKTVFLFFFLKQKKKTTCKLQNPWNYDFRAMEKINSRMPLASACPTKISRDSELVQQKP